MAGWATLWRGSAALLGVLLTLLASRLIDIPWLAGVAAALLCLTVSQISGPAAGVLAISLGVFNSIMFPVIFSLTIERSTAPASATSGLLCMAIVGGAFVPLLFAHVADWSGSRFLAFLGPVGRYLVIAAFGWRAARVAGAGTAHVSPH